MPWSVERDGGEKLPARTDKWGKVEEEGSEQGAQYVVLQVGESHIVQQPAKAHLSSTFSGHFPFCVL